MALVHSLDLWLEFSLSAPITISQHQATWSNSFLPFASFAGPIVLGHFLANLDQSKYPILALDWPAISGQNWSTFGQHFDLVNKLSLWHT